MTDHRHGCHGDEAGDQQDQPDNPPQKCGEFAGDPIGAKVGHDRERQA